MWEPEELNVSARIAKGVEEVIRRSDVFIVLVSRASTSSSWVQWELATALRVLGSSGADKVIPLVLDETAPPQWLQGRRTLHVRNEDWSSVADNLVESHPEISEADFWQEVLDTLEALDVTFEAAPIVGGIRPDFLLRHGDRTMVLEVKPWKGPAMVDMVHGLDQLAFQVDAVGADRGLLVVQEVRTAMPPPEIVPLARLGDAVRAWQREEQEPVAGEEVSPPSPKQIFAAMPFAPEYSDTYRVAMREAAQAVGAGCVRVDDLTFVGDIVEKIEELIRESDAVIVDLSESTPNVLFEYGFALALKKPYVLICSTPLDELPFDIQYKKVITYSKGQTYELKEELLKILRVIL